MVSLHDLGNGHKEACIQAAIDWEDLGSPVFLDACGNPVGPAPLTDQELLDKREANEKRSARRAKTRVRRLCKALGCDCLLTLTYRGNQTDLALCKAHFKAFIRRLKRYIPGFVYVACFERQKRGAWHVHIATHRIPAKLAADVLRPGVRVKSFNVLRGLWRAVAGGFEGNIDSQNAKPWHSPGRLASYLSKYMLKAFEDGDDWSNRYSGSASTAIPPAVRLQFQRATLRELIDLVYGEVCVGDCDTFSWLSRFGDVFYISTEPDLKRPLRPWEI